MPRYEPSVLLLTVPWCAVNSSNGVGEACAACLDPAACMAESMAPDPTNWGDVFDEPEKEEAASIEARPHSWV